MNLQDTIKQLIPERGERIYVAAANWHIYRLFILHIAQIAGRNVCMNFTFVDRPSALYGTRKGAKFILLDDWKSEMPDMFIPQIELYADRHSMRRIEFESRCLNSVKKFVSP